jgi:hypothetical protein
MICIIALFICGVLGIFSARYRSIAKEAFRCVFLRLQFKPCETQLDQKIKSKLTSKLLTRSPRTARFVYKRFELLSWAFTIIFFASMAYTVYGFYNLFTYGTCDPHSDICPLSVKPPVCGCEGVCLCEVETCESPEYQACEGDCDCQREVCKGST